MCLAIPALVLEIKNKMAKVDFGDGTIRDVNISLVDVKVGEYVIVHAGFAIQVMDKMDAMETLQLWNEILSERVN
jgi:hydrogenase expression/formation protein HypC